MLVVGRKFLIYWSEVSHGKKICIEGRFARAAGATDGHIAVHRVREFRFIQRSGLAEQIDN